MSARDGTAQPHHSLPARPPPSYSAPSSRPSNVDARAFAGFTPRSVVARVDTQAAAPMPSATYHTPNYPASNTYNNYSYPAYASSAPSASYPPAPPVNNGSTATFDLEEEARIAEWTSAYSRDDANLKKGSNASAVVRSEAAASTDPVTAPPADGKRKTVVREGGGKQWEDETLLEWNPLHPRLFVGNLAGEVTDESLLKAFAKYPSLSKARVVRDKKSTKSRSYGFVSFADTDDYFRAAKEMQGKYIGSHPVLIKRATSEVKAVTKREEKYDKNRARNKQNRNHKDNKDSKEKAGPSNPALVVASPAMFVPRGVSKKTKTNVPRVLG